MNLKSSIHPVNLISLAFGNPASPTRGSLNGGATFNLYFLPNRFLQKLCGFEFLLIGNSLY